MEQLPKDVWVLMALDLDLQALLNLCRTNKQFNDRICNSQQFWSQRISREYPNIDISEVKDYKELYKYLKNRILVDSVYKQGHAIRKGNEIVIISMSGDRVVYKRPDNLNETGYTFPRFSPQYFNSLEINYIPVAYHALQGYLKTGYFKGEFGEKYKVNINKVRDEKFTRKELKHAMREVFKFRNGEFFYP